ncbi:hypothetical protein BX600DRAFT_383872 [Xylariales sp. PMI_506]|nr:hypothetical protein BX600DRAFT_383872 [Xylariales sp. PMI_506]
MVPLRILISGGGISGNALAFWLSRMGHHVTVVERFPCLRATGLQVDLRGHGIEVLKRMGLEQEFRARAAPEQGMQVVDSTGRRWAYFAANTSGKGLQSFTTEFEIMRGDLCHLLHDAAAKNQVKYMFGTSIESFVENGSSLDVRFTDGMTDQFDLLVGADGQWSRTRGMMLGAQTPDAFYPVDGQYIGYFTTSRPVKEGEKYIATFYFTTGGRCIMTRRHSPNAIQVYLICNTGSKRLENSRGNIKEEKESLTDIFQGGGWQTDDILKALEDADDFYLERLGLVKLESWSRERVVLVGDAAYCPSANTGMGTTSSMVGAYILAGEIGKYCGSSQIDDAGTVSDGKAALGAALKAYEGKFRPFMNQVQAGVLEDKRSSMGSSWFGVAILYCFLAICSFLKINVMGEHVLKERVKGWALPDYEDILTLRK